MVHTFRHHSAQVRHVLQISLQQGLVLFCFLPILQPFRHIVRHILGHHRDGAPKIRREPACLETACVLIVGPNSGFVQLLCALGIQLLDAPFSSGDVLAALIDFGIQRRLLR